MNKRVAITTLGCKVNAYDTEVLKEIFTKADYDLVSFNEPADIYIVNTCTVTNFGDKKSRQLLRRAKRANPKALVIATGCYAQVFPEKLEAIDEIDLIIGPRERDHIINLIEDFDRNQKTFVSDYEKDEFFNNYTIKENDGHTRAYVKVQDGCRQFCTYCIVPYARGPIRSRSIEDTLEEVENLVQNGYKEIVLTGIHIASYGRDSGKHLIELIKAVSKIDGVKRIRLSSLEPRLITEDFLKELVKIPSFCPHFHLSLQNGSNEILKRMNRHYTTEEYQNIVNLIRKFFPDAGITTDIIVGFPGESENDFLQTKNFVEQIGFSKVHIFPYSPRSGTPAAGFPDQIDGVIKNRRVKELSDIEEQERNAFYESQEGKCEEVLFERQIGDGVYSGYSRNYIPVITESEKDLTNIIVPVNLTYYNQDQMKGNIIK